MNYKIFNNKIFIYIFFTILSFLTRYYLFEGRESWHDEWHTIYVADPNLSTAETLARYYGDKGGSFLTESIKPVIKNIFHNLKSGLKIPIIFLSIQVEKW